MATRSIESFFKTSSKRPADDRTPEPPPKRQSLSEPTVSSSPKATASGKDSSVRVRRWLPQWEKQFPWLEKKVVDENEDAVILAVCKWCRDAGKKNAFAVGSPNLKSDGFTRHETRNPEHVVIVLGHSVKDTSHAIYVTIERMRQQETDKAAESNPSLEAQIRTMYTVVKSGQPHTMFNTMCQLQMLNNTPGFQDTSLLYTSHTTHLDMLAAINQTIEDDSKLPDSSFVGHVVDESTDVAVYKKLVLYVRVVSDGGPSIHFVRNMDIPDGKAATIVDAVSGFARSKGLDLARVSSLASDVASEMTGKHDLKVLLSHYWRIWTISSTLPSWIFLPVVSTNQVIWTIFTHKDLGPFWIAQNR